MEFRIPPYEEIAKKCGRIWASGGFCGDNPTEPTASDIMTVAEYLNRNNWYNKEVIALVPQNIVYLLANCQYYKPFSPHKSLPHIGSLKNVTFLLDNNLKRYAEKSKTFEKRYMYLIPMFLKTDKEIKIEDIQVLCISNFLECPNCFDIPKE